MKKLITLLLFSAVVACNQPANKRETPEKGTVAKDTVTMRLKDLTFAVKKDLVCGMSVSAGISDTALYKGKLYGFCSNECKDDFLKDPPKYLATK